VFIILDSGSKTGMTKAGLISGGIIITKTLASWDASVGTIVFGKIE
jgi:hypothetical protein